MPTSLTALGAVAAEKAGWDEGGCDGEDCWSVRFRFKQGNEDRWSSILADWNRMIRLKKSSSGRVEPDRGEDVLVVLGVVLLDSSGFWLPRDGLESDRLEETPELEFSKLWFVWVDPSLATLLDEEKSTGNVVRWSSNLLAWHLMSWSKNSSSGSMFAPNDIWRDGRVILSFGRCPVFPSLGTGLGGLW